MEKSTYTEENAVIASLLTRRSIRAYRPDPVPPADIDRVIAAGLRAASGMGRQSPVILAVTDRTLRDHLMRMNAAVMGREGSDPFYGAPCVLVVLADRQSPTYLYDGALAMGNMMNAAHALGLGSCWIHRAREEFESEEGQEILRTLGIHGDLEGIGHLILGYADGPLPEAKPLREGRVFYAK